MMDKGNGSPKMDCFESGNIWLRDKKRKRGKEEISLRELFYQ
jgi:hypothetical protein